MYFTIKYNIFYKYIIDVTTTAINTCKKVIWRWSKGGNFFFIYVSYLIRESTLYFLNVNKYWHDRKRWEKESNTRCHRFYYLAPLPVLDPIFLLHAWPQSKMNIPLQSNLVLTSDKSIILFVISLVFKVYSVDYTN